MKSKPLLAAIRKRFILVVSRGFVVRSPDCWASRYSAR